MSTTRSANDGFLDIIEINKRNFDPCSKPSCILVSIHKQLVDKIVGSKRKIGFKVFLEVQWASTERIMPMV